MAATWSSSITTSSSCCSVVSESGGIGYLSDPEPANDSSPFGKDGKSTPKHVSI